MRVSDELSNKLAQQLHSRVCKVEKLCMEGDHHRSLGGVPSDKKKRKCLKCGVSFLSMNFGNRICKKCRPKNTNAPKLAQAINVHA